MVWTMRLKDKQTYADSVVEKLTHSREKFIKYRIHGNQIVFYFLTKMGERTYALDAELFYYYLHAEPHEIADYIENFLMYFE